MKTTNLKSLLKIGVFGQMESGRFFVVTDDKFIYNGAGYDIIEVFNEELTCVDDFDYEVHDSVKFIFTNECCSFDCAMDIIKYNWQNSILWSREDYEKEKEVNIPKPTNKPPMPECIEPKKQTPTPTLGEVVSLVDSMRKIMIERQNPATDEAIAKMAKTIYKQFGYELPEIEGE